MSGRQLNIFEYKLTKKVPQCSCGSMNGYKVILNSHSHVGITTQFQDNGVFKNNSALYLENNFCPQCGEKYLEVEVE